MNDDQMRLAITLAIQDNDQLFLLLKSLIQYNIVNVDTPRLTVMMTLLNLSTAG